MAKLNDRQDVVIPLRQGMWRGIDGATESGRGFRRIVNGYVSPDGQEIRRWPGFRCTVDLVSDQDQDGYSDRFVVARRGRSATVGNYVERALPTEQMIGFVRPTNLHGFEFCRGRLLIFGEASLIQEPIEDSTAPGNYLRVVGWTFSGGSIINLLTTGTVGAGGVDNTFQRLAVRDTVYLQGLDLADPVAAELEGKCYVVSNLPGGNVVQVQGVVSGSSTLAHDVALVRVRPCEAARSAGDGVAYYRPANAALPFPGYAVDDPEGLHAWSVNGLQPNVESPLTVCESLMVANRQRDFGDWTTNWIREGYSALASSAGGDGLLGQSRRWQRELDLRLVPDVAGDRLLLAAPGYGVTFQVPLITPIGTTAQEGLNLERNDIYDRPRCLGVPKAVMLDPEDKSNMIGSGSLAAGTYKFRVAYKDDGTGEVGLASDVVEYTVGANGSVTLWVYHPGYLMSECLAFTILVFASEPDADTLGLLATVPLVNSAASTQSSVNGFPTTPGSGVATFGQISISSAITEDDLDYGALPRNGGLEQMPLGCRAVKTIRGITFFVGHAGSVGPRRTIVAGETRGDYDPTNDDYPKRDEIYIQPFDGSVTPVCDRFNVAQPVIPPGYAGKLMLRGQGLFPYPHEIARFDRLTNSRADFGTSFSAFRFATRYVIEDHPHQEGLSRWPLGGSAGSEVEVPTWLELPAGLAGFSLVGDPSKAPSNQVFYLDQNTASDGEAVGHYQGRAIICTRHSTMSFAWGRDPNNESPNLLSSDFGCIAPNSMVEFDGGLAWLSDRGPVAIMGGGIAWIGQPLERDFLGANAEYVRDREGMMRHAWAAHDQERGLIIFGLISRSTVTTDRITYRGQSVTWEQADDEARSRFPCNRLLVFSYRAQAWSVVETPAGLRHLWMRRGMCSDGIERMHFLAEDGRIYTYDDLWADGTSGGVWNFAVLGGTGTSAVQIELLNSINSANKYDAPGDLVRIGSQFLIVRNLNGATDHSARGWHVVAYGTVTGFGASPANQIIADLRAPDGQGVTWKPGDIVMLSIPPAMEIETQFSGNPDTMRISGVELAYSLYSELEGKSPLVGNTRQAYVEQWVRDEDGDEYPCTQPRVGAIEGGAQFIGVSQAAKPAQRHENVRMGKLSREHSVRIRFHGAAQVRVSQIRARIEP